MNFGQLPVNVTPVNNDRMFSYNQNTYQENMNGQNPQYFGEFSDWNNLQQQSSCFHNDWSTNQQFVSSNNNQQYYQYNYENNSHQVLSPMVQTPHFCQNPMQTNNPVNSTPTLEEILFDLDRSDQQKDYTATKPMYITRGRKNKMRYRTAFTTNQIDTLEGVFKKQLYINNDERAELSKMLGLTERAVRVWFQNRRMKQKRSEQNGPDESGTSGVSSPSDIVGSLEDEIKSYDVVNNQVCATPKIYDELGALLQSFLPNVDEKSYGVQNNVINTASDGYSSYSTNANTYVMLDKYEPISPVNSNSDILF